MASTWLIRLVQSDKNKTPILIRLAPKEGGHDLDLDLLATDGEAAYTTKVRQRSLKKLRAKNYDGSDDEWASVISYILGVRKGPAMDPAHKDSLQVTCSVSGKDPKGTLSISFNNRVENITQRLGTIELPQTEETDDVDLFGWASQVIEVRDGLQEEVTSLRQQAKSTNEAMASLQKQLDELVEAKSEHEKEMLSKFALLLNEKKRKIRNMQRILSTAQADPKKLKELETVFGGERTEVGGRNKRSADTAAESEESQESDGFEAMDVERADTPQDEPESPQSGGSTSTASEPDDDDVVGEKLPDRPRTRAMDSKRGMQQKLPSPPPQRELPFQKNATKEKAPQSPADAAEDDEETASEASEL